MPAASHRPNDAYDWRRRRRGRLMYMPSRIVWKELHGVASGLWIDRSRDSELILVVKLSTVVIKALHDGAETKLIVAVERYGRSRVQCVGLEIADDPVSPFVTFGTHSTRREQRDLLECLDGRTLAFFAFDELSRCVLRMTCRVETQGAECLVKRLRSTSPHYAGTNTIIREGALDRFQNDLDAEHAGRSVAALVWCKMPLQIAIVAATNIAAITYDGVGRFRLDDREENAEGSGLEQSVHQLLDNLFGDRLFRSPQVD
jgi:hypothetical protein